MQFGPTEAVHIAWERQFNRLKLYGPPKRVEQLETQYLKPHLAVNSNWAFERLTIHPNQYTWLLPRSTTVLDKMRAECGLESATLDTDTRCPKAGGAGSHGC